MLWRMGLSSVLAGVLIFLLGVVLATGSSGVTAIEVGMALMLVGLFITWDGVHKLHQNSVLSFAFWRERFHGQVLIPYPAWFFEQSQSILERFLGAFVRLRNSVRK